MPCIHPAILLIILQEDEVIQQVSSKRLRKFLSYFLSLYFEGKINGYDT